MYDVYAVSCRSTCPECGAYVTADKIVPNMLVSKLLEKVRCTLDDEVRSLRAGKASAASMRAGIGGAAGAMGEKEEGQQCRDDDDDGKDDSFGVKRRRTTTGRDGLTVPNGNDKLPNGNEHPMTTSFRGGSVAAAAAAAVEEYGTGTGAARAALANAMNCVRVMGAEELQAMSSVLEGRQREIEDEFKTGGINLLSDFLIRCRERKRGELRLVQSRLGVLEGHIAAAEAAINGSIPSANGAGAATVPGGDDTEPLGNGSSGGGSGGGGGGGGGGCSGGGGGNANANGRNTHSPEVSLKRRQIASHLEELRGNYLQSCAAGGDGLSGFCEKFSTFLRYRHLRCIAKLSYSSSPHPESQRMSSNIVSSIEFDAGEERFATAGVSKRIHVYDFNALIESGVSSGASGDGSLLLDLGTRSKLSCLSWSKFSKHQLASSDYEGIVNVWDVETAQSVIEYEEHEKRVWTVDFSRTSGPMMVSGSDDGRVKVWSITQPNSVCSIDMRANVCCVKYNPATHNQVAIGCADHNVHIYDLRKINTPLQVLSGHRKAVSYVRYASSTEVVSASTDGTLRVWETGAESMVKTLSGHTNEKNFVGLSVTSQFVCCGSETNDVYVYYKHVSGPLAKYNFNSDEDAPRGANPTTTATANNNTNSNSFPGGGEATAAIRAAGDTGNGATVRQQQQQQQRVTGGTGNAGGAANGGAGSRGHMAGESNQFISSLCWKGESSILLASNSQGSIRALKLDP